MVVTHLLTIDTTGHLIYDIHEHHCWPAAVTDSFPWLTVFLFPSLPPLTPGHLNTGSCRLCFPSKETQAAGVLSWAPWHREEIVMEEVGISEPLVDTIILDGHPMMQGEAQWVPFSPVGQQWGGKTRNTWCEQKIPSVGSDFSTQYLSNPEWTPELLCASFFLCRIG